LPNVWKPSIIHRTLNTDEFKEYVKGFEKGASVAKNAGFDGVEIHEVTEGKIGDHNIEFTVKDEVKSLETDTIITSIGYINDKSLYDAIIEKGIETHIIGDSNKVSNLLGAIWDGYELAMTI
jgi:hypothetical protein